MEDIDFSDAAMFASTAKPAARPPALAPLARAAVTVAADPPAPLVPRCRQCGHAYGIAFHTRNIYRRGEGWKEERFCSEACGADYQMGCEG